MEYTDIHFTYIELRNQKSTILKWNKMCTPSDTTIFLLFYYSDSSVRRSKYFISF